MPASEEVELGWLQPPLTQMASLRLTPLHAEVSDDSGASSAMGFVDTAASAVAVRQQRGTGQAVVAPGSLLPGRHWQVFHMLA